VSDSKREKIANATLELIAERGEGKTICPSEVARQVFSEDKWRDEMEFVREVAQELIDCGYIQATQKGKVIKSAVDARGPLRLRKATSQ
jgi:hypothetical protein